MVRKRTLSSTCACNSRRKDFDPGLSRSGWLFLFQMQQAFLRVDVHAEVAQEIQT